jgi:hypothetical protein
MHRAGPPDEPPDGAPQEARNAVRHDVHERDQEDPVDR